MPSDPEQRKAFKDALVHNSIAKLHHFLKDLNGDAEEVATDIIVIDDARQRSRPSYTVLAVRRTQAPRCSGQGSRCCDNMRCYGSGIAGSEGGVTYGHTLA